MVDVNDLNNVLVENLRVLDEEDFDALRVKVITERERRDALAVIPQTIAQNAAHFRAIGGREEDLTAAIAPVSEEPDVDDE